MRYITVLALGAAHLSLVTPASAQLVAPVSRDVHLSDFGIDDPAEIRKASVMVVYASGGPRLSVTELRDRGTPTWTMSLESAAPAMGSACFNLGIEAGAATNALGGRFGAYALRASSAGAEVARDEDGRRVLTFECDRGGGSCGLWLHLFETANPRRRTLIDATRVESLAFWLHSSAGGPAVDLKLADARWLRLDDSRRVGPLSDFTRGTAVDGWRRVRVPLGAIPAEIARDSLGSLVFDVAAPGRAELRLAGLELCSEGGGSCASTRCGS